MCHECPFLQYQTHLVSCPLGVDIQALWTARDHMAAWMKACTIWEDENPGLEWCSEITGTISIHQQNKIDGPNVLFV